MHVVTLQVGVTRLPLLLLPSLFLRSSDLPALSTIRSTMARRVKPWAALPLLLAALAAFPSGSLSLDASVLPDTACFDCPWLDLPLDEWSAERNSSAM